MNPAVNVDDTSMRVVSIFDTTLRDGEQAPRNGMTAENKVDMALRLEALGVDVVEVGFPAASPTDYKAAKLAAQSLQRATIATLSRTTRADVEVAVDAIGVERHQVQLLATASDLHLEHKRGISRSDAVREVSDATRFAASLGVTDISVGLEDASRGDPDLLRALVDAGLEAGATTVAVGDTSGCLVPQEYGELIAMIRSWLPAGTTLSTHCHDDMGLALANALAGVAAGADQVQTTLAGVGERSGNTPLEELAAVLAYKSSRLGAVTRIRTGALYEAYLALKNFMRLEEVRNKAIVGSNAFATAAGIHQLGVLQRPETYEYLEPGDFGRERSILISRHSGRAVLRYLVEERGAHLEPEAIGQLYEELIGSRTDGEVETLGQLGAQVAERLKARSGVDLGELT
jgi:2-isopropylmalate synthase